MVHKKTSLLAVSALSLCILTLPLSSQAGDLVIDNQTFFPSTSKINNQSGHAHCSNEIPNYGVTPAHTKNTIPSGVVWLACITNLNSCTADVYMSKDCSGPVIANVTFNYYTGIQNINNNYGSDGFVIANPPRSAFYVDIMGGPVNFEG